jgi:hypothetical protein
MVSSARAGSRCDVVERQVRSIDTAMAEVTAVLARAYEVEGLPVPAAFGGKPAPAPRERHGMRLERGAGEASGPRCADLQLVSGGAR